MADAKKRLTKSELLANITAATELSKNQVAAAQPSPPRTG